METVFKGQRVNRQNILEALREFSAEYPDTDSYENWLEKDTYIYAVWYEDKIFPPKHILSRATAIPTAKFSGGEQTNRVFRQLGFKVTFK